MALGTLPGWTLDDCRRECAGLKDVKRFEAMVDGGKNLLIYNRIRFERDTASGAWKMRWVLLGGWRVGILMDTRFEYMPFIWCEQEQPYCRRLRDAIVANVEVAEGDQ